MSKDKKTVKGQWSRILKNALDADNWAQPIEAMEEYEKLVQLIDKQIPELMGLTSDERGTLMKFRHAISLRIEMLGDINSADGLSLKDIQRLAQVLDDLFVRPVNFPITMSGYTAIPSTPKHEPQKSDHQVLGLDSITEKKKDNSTIGTLKPPLNASPGQTTMEVYVDKIGLKDAQTYIDSRITVSVVDGSGRVLDTQDTSTCKQQKPSYVVFEQPVHLQVPWEKVKSNGYKIFFEFKHHKPKKKKISTRCFAVMESHEIEQRFQQPAVCLELYRKPTDFSLKRLNLFTIKKLYLIVSVTFHTH
mmetsp:Transcript_22727/g.32084  ORF Transcript_22727/g.32084 Transcript_22727/m.32084 type:complete len:304 (+) Transcript_22727:45-956(+)